MQQTIEQIALVAERYYIQFVRAHGTPRAGGRRLEIQEPLRDDGITDCWTHAWRYAVANGARYVEGLCMKRPGVLATHAWCEVEGPLGRTIVELTPGFEDASLYAGLVIDTSPDGIPASVTADWDGGEPRSSVLQSAIAGGWEPRVLLDMLVVKETP